jgi:alanyl-tRNA synthetase
VIANDIRRSFLKYFERHGHRIVPSSSLVPQDDPTLLFTNAGMNQFKDVFLGRDTRDYARAATVQKCMRVSGKHNDLDNVGPSFRHHTFFEMLGNFSFGDYFKRDAIPFAWKLLTEEWSLPEERLYPTVFRGEAGIPRDDEAYDLWRRFLPSSRVGELGASDNFWQMGDTGPCGRCSEIYYYRGPDVTCPAEARGEACRGLECECDRFIEIWNNVFMEFDRQRDGALKPLPAPSIDTGMGLERVTAVLQGHLSNYDTDLFTPILAAIGERAGRLYRGTMEPADISMRVIADHQRAMSFLAADGVVPSNEKRGYVLRKIMRRAMRHGKRLGLSEPFLHALVDTVVREFGHAYPELQAGRDAIIQIVRTEEERFDAVLTGGLPRLEDVLDRAAAGNRSVPGEDAFRLYDTYGLPRDFIEDMIEERKLSLDREGFERAMEGQREKARAKSAFKGTAQEATWTADTETAKGLQAIGENVFRGYDRTSAATQIVAVFGENREQKEVLSAGQKGFVALAETPFYLEAGGQVSDAGRISSPHGEARVTGMARVPGWPRLHAVELASGTLRERDFVTAEVDVEVRDATRRNHTATHLLHAALRRVLGGHVTQAGSLVTPDRLRFDFVHFAALTREQMLKIELIVNEQVLGNTRVETDIKNTQEAIAAGAMALFGEKYGERVRVVSIPGFSIELCGGTHVRATGDIGLFAVVAESGVAAGVRRIEAITGLDALKVFQRNRDEIAAIAAALNARPGELATRVSALQDSNKRLERELETARMNALLGASAVDGSGGVQTAQIGSIKLQTQQFVGVGKDALGKVADKLKSRLESGIVVVASDDDGKVAIVVTVTPDLTKKAPAGQIVKQIAPIVGGGGGGRPDFAEAGGKDPSKIGEMLAASRSVVEKMLSA